jgi:hypothetical protein
LFLILFYPGKTSAASFNFNIASISANTISSGTQEIDVNLNISNLPTGDSYFRVALQKENGSYLGYVQSSNNDWSTIQTLGGDCTIYYKANDPATTSLTLKFKLGDDISLDNGNYKLKAHRFTSTCKSYSEATNDFNINVNLPTPTPTPTLEPTESPTGISTPTPTITPKPTPTPTLRPSPSVTKILVATKTAILGTSSQSAKIQTPKVIASTVKVASASKNNFLAAVLILLGIVFLLACGIVFFYPYIINFINRKKYE